MPKSRRDKVVSLTAVQKKGRDAKSTLMDAVRAAAQAHAYIWVLSVAGMRTKYLSEVRDLWKGSRIVFGRVRVMARALGETEEEECREGVRGISSLLAGPVGLLFTDELPAAVIDWFDTYSRQDFARAGNRASQDVVLPEGPLMMRTDPPETLPHPLEPQLRKLGLPTQLKRGVPTLLREHVVCKKGQVLTADAAQILKHLLIQDATFQIVPLAHWDASTSSVTRMELSPAQQAAVGKLHELGASKRGAANASRAKKPKGVLLHDSNRPAAGDDDEGSEEEESDEEMEEEDKVDASMMLPAGLAL